MGQSMESVQATCCGERETQIQEDPTPQDENLPVNNNIITETTGEMSMVTPFKTEEKQPLKNRDNNTCENNTQVSQPDKQQQFEMQTPLLREKKLNQFDNKTPMAQKRNVVSDNKLTVVTQQQRNETSYTLQTFLDFKQLQTSTRQDEIRELSSRIFVAIDSENEGSLSKEEIINFLTTMNAPQANAIQRHQYKENKSNDELDEATLSWYNAMQPNKRAEVTQNGFTNFFLKKNKFSDILRQKLIKSAQQDINSDRVMSL